MCGPLRRCRADSLLDATEDPTWTGGVAAEDRPWAAFLYDDARLADVPVEVVHRAGDHDLVPIPFDDVLDESA